MIIVKHRAKNGGSSFRSFVNYKKACEYLVKLFKQRLEARLYVNDELMGEVYKNDNWNYYYNNLKNK